MTDMIHIRIQVELPDGKQSYLNYAIGAKQAEQLYVGSPPDDFSWIRSEWSRRSERADALARMIATELAHKIVEMVNVRE